VSDGEVAELCATMAAGREEQARLSAGEPGSVEEREALVAAVTAGRAARAQCIEANTGLVYLAAGRFPVAGVDRDDLVVAAVDPGSAAASVGIVSGDVIIGFDGSSTRTTTGLSKAIDLRQPGRLVTVTVGTPAGTKVLRVCLREGPVG
jgi:S1-C subfamily serine protease